MRLLVLGGTAFLGRAVAAQAVGAGHAVTCVARGESGQVPDGVTWVRADREHPLELEGEWDAVVDVARQPGHVRRAVEALRDRVPHFVLVSTGNVYADHSVVGADESARLLPALDGDVMPSMEQYGEAKVACEQHVLRGFGEDRSTLVRVGLIGGPTDPSGRASYWPWRFAHPSVPDGRVLAPDALDEHCQVIDVRDLASWLVHLAESRVAGTFNATGDTTTLGEHLEVARKVAGHTGDLVLADQAWLQERGVQPWSGPRSLPLWIGDPAWVGFPARSNARARAAGLVLRPLSQTLEDTLRWREALGAPLTTAGLSDDDERELLGLLAGP